MAAGKVNAAGEVLRLAAPMPNRAGRLAAPDFNWETSWIDYLERSGETDTAQAVRWASFEQTLDANRARAFTTGSRALTMWRLRAALRPCRPALRLPARAEILMAWPALPEASRMLETREEDIQVDAAEAELWAAKLRRRYPVAEPAAAPRSSGRLQAMRVQGLRSTDSGGGDDHGLTSDPGVTPRSIPPSRGREWVRSWPAYSCTSSRAPIGPARRTHWRLRYWEPKAHRRAYGRRRR